MSTSVRKKPQQKSNTDKTTVKSAGSQVNKQYVLVSIVIITAIVFSNSVTRNFLAFDDYDYIINNKYIRSLSLESIKAIFTSFYYANYHPLTTLFYAVEYRLFGLNPASYHLINLLIHLANVCLVFVLLERLSQRKEIAVIGALLFGIHPMHVESVSWISERKDVLYALFYIAALITYLKYIRLNESKWLLLTFSLFVLSLLSKPAANTFPLLMVLFDYYSRRGWGKKVLLEKIPFFLLSIVFGVVTIFAQKAGGALDDIAMPHYSAVQRIFVVSYSLIFYLVRFFLPLDLCALHYAPKELPFYYYLSPLALAFIVYMVIKAKLMKRELIFGSLFYLFSIFLVVQIIPIGYTVVSERYSYIPYIGLFLIAGSFYVNVQEGKISLAPSIKHSLKYIIVTIAIVFAVLSFQRNKIWNNTLSLFTDNSAKNPTSALAQFVLGEKLYETGDFNGALDAYSRSLALDSTIAQVYFWRGNVYNRQENYPLAIKDFLKAIQLKPDYGEAYNNVGTIYFKTGKYKEAVPYFTECIKFRPTEYLYVNRGTSHFYLKKYLEAIEDYNKALEINPSLKEVHFNRGACYFYLQKIKEACDNWKKASSMGYEKADAMIGSYCK